MHSVILHQIEGQHIYLLYKLPLEITYFHFPQCPQKITYKSNRLIDLFFSGEKMDSIYEKGLVHVTKLDILK